MGGGSISVEFETSPENGTVEVVGSLMLYTPSTGFLGEDSFTYKMTDVDGETSSAMVSVSITAASSAREGGIIE